MCNQCMASPALAIPEITLTSSPPPSSNGYFCPGPVQYTCVGTEINGLTWRIDNTYRASYVFNEGDGFPLALSLSPDLTDVTILITSASSIGTSQNNIESTLSVAQVSVLSERDTVECISSNLIRSSLTIDGTQGK